MAERRIRERAEHARAEYLTIRGRLDRAGRFTPRRCTSTPFVHRWPKGTTSEELVEIGAGRGEVALETVTADDVVLPRELAEVRSEQVCAPGEAQTFRVLGYIGLLPEAERVRVVREVRVLWEMRIPEAPSLRVSLERYPVREERPHDEAEAEEAQDDTAQKARRRKEPSGSDGAVALLALRFSEPADPDLAHVSVMFQWSERGYRTVHVGPPAELVEIDTSELPGGTCRFVVTYSNGLRSAADVTKSFDLAELGAQVRVVRPEQGEKVTAGVPVPLEGVVVDPEHPAGGRETERLVWLVDDEEVGQGPVTSVDRLEPGEHTVRLVYRGDAETSVTATIRAVPAKDQVADDWPTWDPLTLP